MSHLDSPRFPEVVKRSRQERGWAQQDLADELGVPSNTVSRWERGLHLPEPQLRQRLCKLFNMTLEELGLVSDPSSDLWNIPFNHNSLFTGREALLVALHKQFNNHRSAYEELRGALHKQFDNHRTATLIQVQALYGLGGVGKTQIAVEYAYRHRHSYRTVLWVSAATEESLRSGFVRLAELAGLAEKDIADQDVVIAAVKRWLTQRRQWLLILDNVDDVTVVMVRDFLADVEKTDGHVLLTTRIQFLGNIAHCIPVEKMDQKEGSLLLLRRAGLLTGDATLDQVAEKDRVEAEAIVVLLGGLPLAIDQAGAYIEETRCGLSRYLGLYQTRHGELLRQRGQAPTDYPETVATTWSLSFRKIENANPAAADLLRVCAFLAPDAIPEEIITEGIPPLTETVTEDPPHLGSALRATAADPVQFNEAVRAVLRYSLIQRDEQMRTLSVHRLVQTVLKDEMNLQTQKWWAEYTVRALNRVFPDVEFSVWSRCQQCIPHVLACVALIEQWNMVFVEAARLLDQTGKYLTERAQYEQAEPLLTRARMLREQSQGPEHLDMVSTLNNLASLYNSLGKYTRAELLYMEARAICEQVRGAEHPAVAQCLNNLARVYDKQGRYEEAGQYYQQALDIREKTLDPEHPNIATTCNDLACLRYNQGEYVQAEPLHRRALRIWQQQPQGLECPDAATSLNGLATLYRSLGKYKEAERLYQRVLEIRQKVLGPEHPDVATTRNDLAWLYRVQGEYARAGAIYEEVLAIRERVLKPGHPDVATTRNDQAVLYMDQGKYQQVEQLFQKVLTDREQTLGPEHPRVATSCNNIGWLYFDMGKYALAELHHGRALRIRIQVLGAQHPDVARSWNAMGEVYRAQGKYSRAEDCYNEALRICELSVRQAHPLRATFLNALASLYVCQGKYGEAEELYRQVLGIRKRFLGVEHPRVAQTLSNIATLYVLQGKYGEAEKLYQRVRKIRENVLGQEHPEVGQTLHGLAHLYLLQGEYKQARTYCRQALMIRKNALGQEHPEVAQSFHGLAWFYHAQGEYSQAEQYYQQALEIREKALGSEHPEVSQSCHDLALLYFDQHRDSLALPLFLRALRIREKVLGECHPSTIDTVDKLIRLYQKTGQHEKADRYFQRLQRCK